MQLHPVSDLNIRNQQNTKHTEKHHGVHKRVGTHRGGTVRRAEYPVSILTARALNLQQGQNKRNPWTPAICMQPNITVHLLYLAIQGEQSQKSQGSLKVDALGYVLRIVLPVSLMSEVSSH